MGGVAFNYWTAMPWFDSVLVGVCLGVFSGGLVGVFVWAFFPYRSNDP